MNRIAKEVKEELYNLADENFKNFHSNLCPGTDNILGIKIPKLREYAKQILKKYNVEELFYSIDEELYEEKMLKGMIIRNK